MEKEFVPYRQSFDLKELGFDEPCFRGWDKDNNIWYHPDSDIILDNPTFSQAFRWFREKYNLTLCVIEEYHHEPLVYKFQILNLNINIEERKYHNKKFFIESIDDYKTYEEAELECLKKLIKIVKK